MKIRINKTALQDLTKVLGNVMNTSGILPEMRFIMLQTEGNDVVAYGGGDDLKIREVINSSDVTVSEGGAMCIKFAYLKEIAKKVGDELVTIESNDNQIIIKSGKSKFKLNSFEPSMYSKPAFETKPSDVEYTMPMADVKDILDRVSFSTSTNDARPVLIGINFAMKNGKLTVTATDSYRLSQVVFDGYIDIPEYMVTIPKNSVKKINDLFAKEEDVKWIVGNRRVMVMGKNILLSTVLIDGNYPDVSRLIPTYFGSELTINRVELLRAVERTSLFKEDSVSVIKFTYDPELGIVNVFAKTHEVGEYSEDLETAKWNGLDSKFSISMSAEYLLDAVKSYSCEEIILKFVGNMKPFLVINKSEERVTQLLLPIRTYD